MNTLLHSMSVDSNVRLTENGAITRTSTCDKLMDMFAMGGAMRKRSESDVILMFKNAYDENPVYALKCLFYLRDVRGGQGERRFFRTCLKWLAGYDTEAASRNLEYVAEFGRWDDLYCFEGTKLESMMFRFIKHQLALDIQSNTPSLLAKWLKSENASSPETTRLGNKTRLYLGMTHKQYRKMLAALRTKINIVEKLMSENRWDEIEFDKIPSRAGLLYKNAFARRDIIKAKYEKFARDDSTEVNADALYPYEVVAKAIEVMDSNSYWYRPKDTIAFNNVNRLMVNKYWDNLADYFKGATLNALCMIDTSGSMHGDPINVAVSLGLYCAERARGPFANHYISFASSPKLIECEGIDFCDKVDRIVRTNLCDNTNIEAAFDMVLKSACTHHVAQEDMPDSIIVISDMEFDEATGFYSQSYPGTLMENIAKTWERAGYKMPKLIFWNVDARHDNIPMRDNGRVSYVSGFSPTIFESIMTGKTGKDLMYDTLDKERYACIR